MINSKTKMLIIFLCLLFLNVQHVQTLNAQGSKKLIFELEQAITEVADSVGNAVVSISTERTSYVNSYFRSFGDDILDQFFRDFFYGEIPQREYKQIGLGSGVIIDKHGNILTNEHVIAGAEKITVTLADGREFIAQLKGADYRSDLAVIKIQADDLPFAKLGDSNQARAGQWAIAIGNPFAFAVQSPKPTVTFGIISALDRSLPRTVSRRRSYLDLIQTDAAINPGNSGGPLVNINGEVIGINVAIFSTSGGSDGIGFAIPINDAKLILEKLLKGEEILYGWIGIGVQDINRVLADYFQLKKPNGVLILEVVKNSPAEKAGLQPEDIIINFNGEKVINTLDFFKKVGRTKAGEEAKLKVIRNSLPRTIKIKLGKTPIATEITQKNIPKAAKQPSNKQKTEKKTSAAANKKAGDKTPLDSWRGLKVSEITVEFASNFGLDSGTYGVIVTKVIPGSPAELAGLKAKDIISQINQLPVKTLDDYRSAISNVSGNVLIKTNRGYLMVQE